MKKIIIFTFILIFIFSFKINAVNIYKLLWYSAIEIDKMQSKNFYHLDKENAILINGEWLYEGNPIIRNLNKKEYNNYNKINKILFIIY